MNLEICINSGLFLFLSEVQKAGERLEVMKGQRSTGWHRLLFLEVNYKNSLMGSQWELKMSLKMTQAVPNQEVFRNLASSRQEKNLPPLKSTWYPKGEKYQPSNKTSVIHSQCSSPGSPPPHRAPDRAVPEIDGESAHADETHWYTARRGTWFYFVCPPCLEGNK